MTCCWLSQDIPEGGRIIAGYDGYGYYKPQLMELDKERILETRSYFYSGGALKRVSRIMNEEIIRSDEWSEDGDRRITTSYVEREQWLWEKIVDGKNNRERISINRDAFVFLDVSDVYIRALEDGDFDLSGLPNISNESFRETVLDLLGPQKVVPELPMEVIDQCGSNRLLKCSWDGRHDPWCFVELHCTSTAKVSYLRVPPGFTDALSAIAWTFGMDRENYHPEKET